MMSRVRMLANMLQQGGLYLLLFLLPFSKAACEISFGLLFVGWMLDRFSPDTRRDTVWLSKELRPLVIFMGLFLAVCALSITVSDHPSLGIRAFFSKWLEYLLMTVMLTDVVRRPGILRNSLVFIAIGICGVVIECITQEIFHKGIFRGYQLGDHGPFNRMTGPYENPNDLATYLMVVAPILMTLGLVLRGNFRRISLSLSFLLIGCLARTEALAAWIGFGGGLVLFACGHRPARKLAMGAVLLCALFGILFLTHTGHLHDIFSTTEVAKTERLAWLQSSIAMIRDRPILGHGLNTFMANYLDYWVGGTHAPVYAHNCYLQMAAETGMVGLSMFLAVLGGLFVRLFSGIRRLDPQNSLILLGFVTGLVAFAIQAALDTNFYSLRQSFLFWSFSGIALGLSQRKSFDMQK